MLNCYEIFIAQAGVDRRGQNLVYVIF